MKKGLQKFSKEYLEQTKNMTADQIFEFIENFRQLHFGNFKKEKSILISMKIQPSLLEMFKQKSKSKEIPYQTQIKILMEDWLKKAN